MGIQSTKISTSVIIETYVLHRSISCFLCRTSIFFQTKIWLIYLSVFLNHRVTINTRQDNQYKIITEIPDISGLNPDVW